MTEPMRWSAFAVVALAVITLQTACVRNLDIAGARPDGVLVVVVFFALHARYPAAVMSGAVLGLGVGLVSHAPLGLFVAVYAGGALLVTRVRDFLFVRHVLTRIVVTGTVALIIGLVCALYVRVTYGARSGPFWRWAEIWVGDAGYTALLAVPVHALLLRGGRWLGIRRSR